MRAAASRPTQDTTTTYLVEAFFPPGLAIAASPTASPSFKPQIQASPIHHSPPPHNYSTETPKEEERGGGGGGDAGGFASPRVWPAVVLFGVEYVGQEKRRASNGPTPVPDIGPARD